VEFLALLSWVVPVFALIFVIASLWQILRALGDISAELVQIRQALQERNAHR